VRVYRELRREEDRPLVLAIGFFDGLHRGHRMLLNHARALRKPGWRVGVLTFENHPASFLRPGNEPPLICTPEERLRLFARAAVEECFIVKFDASVAQLTPEEFMRDVLVDALGARGVVVGSGFKFGHKRAGDAPMMARFFGSLGIAFDAVENLTDGGERISSTRIRALIADGQTARADELLGTGYEIRGVVERGAGRGAHLGFPTANVRPPAKLLPKDGVYAATARFEGRDRAALVSIGTNPTFGPNERTVEAWIRDFHETIYGCELWLRDFRFVRDQRAFASSEALQTQMRLDLEAVAYPSFA
jgi:riboflavin kinase/FMN adenylyltransferase